MFLCQILQNWKKKEKKSFTRIGVSILEFYSTFC